jgi:hypothetical protein
MTRTTLVVQWEKSHDNVAKDLAQDVHNEAHHIAHSYGRENPPYYFLTVTIYCLFNAYQSPLGMKSYSQ